MTREHKLALIVGFSLILLVGVLISDHLSRARQAKIVPVGPGETQVAETRTNDPLRNADGYNALVQPPSPVTIVQQTTGPTPATTTPTTTAGTTPVEPPALGGNENRGGNWPPVAGTSNAHDALSREVALNRGWIDDKGVIHLPGPAMQIDQTRLMTNPMPTSPLPPSPNSTDNVKLYTVQKGDTLLKIAQANYGSPRLWHELAKYNGISENGLRLGAKIKLPTRELLTGKPTETAARPGTPGAPATKTTPVRSAPLPAKPAEIRYATYTVKAGDTLGHISQRMLGSSRRIQDIIDLNKLDDEDTIPVGTILKMPVKG